MVSFLTLLCLLQALILGMLEENCLVNMAEYAFSKMGDHMSDKQLQSLEVGFSLKFFFFFLPMLFSFLFFLQPFNITQSP